MTNKITLKNIKHSAFASEETPCYEASVYFGTKRVGTVKNSGHGGCDYQTVTDEKGWGEMEKYIATLPDETVKLSGVKTFTLKPSLEIICHDLINDHLTRQDLKRLLSRRVVFINNKGQMLQTNCVKRKETLNVWINEVADQDDVTEVLNLLPFNQALEVYKNA